MKEVVSVFKGPQAHWVGDGFPVRTLFSYDRLGKSLSPFLLLDYAGPAEFAPSAGRRGVGEHAHRGFETVTIVYSGEVDHRDSAGNGGSIGPGDVQWMTAASGLLHEEFHSPGFTQRGGTLEMAQLWVNLPAKDKSAPPRYQSIVDAAIPQVELPQGAGRLRVIAGSFDGHKGPAMTHTPLEVWDLRLAAGASVTLPLAEGHNTAVAVLRGAVVAGGEIATGADFILYSAAGAGIMLEAREAATLLVLSGEPINEPIVGYGPFVMNTRQEIETAFKDLQAGRFGQMPA
ncbi:MAG: pirin family protein [Pseudomonadota bacterium]